MKVLSLGKRRLSLGSRLGRIYKKIFGSYMQVQNSQLRLPCVALSVAKSRYGLLL